MKALDRRLHFAAVGGAGLDQQQDFGRGFDAALPTVDRLQAGQNIDAGRQLELDQAMGDKVSLFAIGAGGENDLKIGHEVTSGLTKYGSFCGGTLRQSAGSLRR
jgi:hypothetical protein